PSFLDKQMLTTKIGGQHEFRASNYFLRPKPKKPPPLPESDESSFDSSPSQISWQLGHIGKRSGSRDGIQTFPHSATTGVPFMIASVSLSFGTKCLHRSWSPGSVDWRCSSRSRTPVDPPLVSSCGS